MKKCILCGSTDLREFEDGLNIVANNQSDNDPTEVIRTILDG